MEIEPKEGMGSDLEQQAGVRCTEEFLAAISFISSIMGEYSTFTDAVMKDTTSDGENPDFENASVSWQSKEMIVILEHLDYEFTCAMSIYIDYGKLSEDSRSDIWAKKVLPIVGYCAYHEHEWSAL